MGDNESEDREVMVGDSEWGFIICDRESENIDVLVGVSERVVVGGEHVGELEGVSRPGGSSAGSTQRV